MEPQLSIYSTPDFGRSEVWADYALKDFLGRSLKEGKVPFWSKDVGGGYPVFAEGRVGTFFLPNTLLYYFLPSPLAWNLSYVTSFILIYIGTYLFVKNIIKSNEGAIFAASLFTFCGFLTVHIPHTSLIQTASLMPLVFWSAGNVYNKATKGKVLVMAFLVSQQIFAGHLQITLITVFSVILFYAFLSREKSIAAVHFRLRYLFIALIFSAMISAPQVLPSTELLTRSVRGRTAYNEQVKFPFPTSDLLTLIFPRYRGTPENGTFPYFTEWKGIFWENNLYIGIVPVVLVVLSIFLMKRYGITERRKIYGIFIVILILSVISFGPKTPFSGLFFIPLFNSFRVAQRFFLPSLFLVSVVAAINLKYFLNIIPLKFRYFSFVILLLATIVPLLRFGYAYNPTVPFSDFLKVPEIKSYLHPGERVYLLPGSSEEWNRLFLEDGWRTPTQYLPFRNELRPYTNLLWDQPTVLAEEAVPLKRQVIIYLFPHLNFISAQSGKYIISIKVVDRVDPYRLIGSVPTEGPTYYLYENKANLERFRFVPNYEVIDPDLNNPEWNFNNSGFNFGNAVKLEEEIGKSFSKSESKVDVISDTDRELRIDVQTDSDQILVIADTPYPGWLAKIDGDKTKILNANYFQRAIIVSQGEHEVVLRYVPYTFYLGVLISLISLIVYFKLPTTYFFQPPTRI